MLRTLGCAVWSVVFVSVVATWFVGGCFAQTPIAVPSVLSNLPNGWNVSKSFKLQENQKDAISKQFDFVATEIYNSILSSNDGSLQVNVIGCGDKETASKVATKLRQTKQNPFLISLRGNDVIEFVGKRRSDLFLALLVRRSLELYDPEVTYAVSFEATSLSKSDDESRQELFEVFQDDDGAKSMSRFKGKFEIDRNLTLYNQNSATQWKVAKGGKKKSRGAMPVFELDGKYKKFRIPAIELRANLVISSCISKNSKVDVTVDTAPNDYWPSENKMIANVGRQIQASNGYAMSQTRLAMLSKIRDEIIEDAPGPESQKLVDERLSTVDRVLQWMSSPRNFRYGKIAGTRIGVDKFLRSKVGRCWDYSDLAITILRSAKIPARQVFGWLENSDGHVWIEVSLDDKTWVGFDPTTGLPVDTAYLPFATSTTGHNPLFYITPPEITVQQTAPENPDGSKPDEK